MSDSDASSPKPPPPTPGSTPPPRTTGGNWRWEPPSAEDLQALMPGYTIEKLLGRGGMGAVYRGVQTNLDRPVAIKILPPGVEKEDPSFAERFKSEAKLMAKLMHPGVVAVFDFGTTLGGQLYFAMEYVDGSDVSQMIAAQGKLPPEHALAITAHVCDALAAAHELGIVHRDIKPANVLLNMKGQVKVADFGLAKVEEPGQHGLTKTGYAMGTPDFVAPEALTLGTAIDGRADLYAVGVMLYQMLTGNIPRGAFKPASVLVPGLDPRFDPIILKAMQHDREERHQSAAELRRELDVILTVPLVQNNAPASAAIPVAQVAQVPGQRSVAQRPAGKAPQPDGRGVRQNAGAAPANTPNRTLASAPTAKSKAPLLIGLGVAAAIGIGAFVMFGGGRSVRQNAESAPASTPPDRTLASAPTKPAPAPPKPVPATPSAPVSKSPALPVAASSDKFPPGQWVKVLTKAEDLPAQFQKAGSGVRLHDGKLEVDSISTYLGLALGAGNMNNCAVRATILADEFNLSMRGEVAGKVSYLFKATSIEVGRPTTDGSPADLPRLVSFTAPPKTEQQWEFGAVGNSLITRRGGVIIGFATDARIKIGMPVLANVKGTIRDIEVINLDGLSGSEALKILGVDEKGNDLRQKPSTVASTTPAAATPAASPPTPAAAKAAMAPASSSPSLPVSQSSPAFPPGQWVKVFTKFEDLPEAAKSPQSGGTVDAEGWITMEKARGLPIEDSKKWKNSAIRMRCKFAGSLAEAILRDQGTKNYQLRLRRDGTGQMALYDGALGGNQNIVATMLKTPTTDGSEHELEFGIVNNHLVGRIDSHVLHHQGDIQSTEGIVKAYGLSPMRNIEVINLDGLPEAEALRILGVDEKGNDLRALAAKQEQQMEQAKAVDAMAAIPELKALHEQFVKLQGERVTAPFEAEVAKLNAGYVGGIDREIANEKKAGHLDGVIALEAEKKLIQGVTTSSRQPSDTRRLAAEPRSEPVAPCPIPAEDDEKATEALKKLRGIYRAAYAKLEATRAENLKALTDPLSIRLKQLESTLTQQNRVPDAKVVREYREGLGRAAASPAAASGPASTNRANAALGGPSALPKKKFPPGDDRKAAEWVLSVGGSVSIAGISTRITDVADLPRGRFELVGVYLEFTSADQVKAPIDNFLPLAGLEGLRRLNVKNVPTTEAHWEILPSLPLLEGFLVERTGVTDAVFAQLAATKVKNVDLNYEPMLTGEGIEALRAAKNLEKIIMNDALLTEEGLRQIGRLESLSFLALSGSGNKLRDGHLPLLAGLKNLKSLLVRRSAITAEGLAGIRKWNDLTTLGFDFPPGTTATQVALLAKAFPKLETMSMQGEAAWNYAADDISALAGFPRLKNLAVSTSAINDEALAGVLALPKLGSLRLADCANVTDATLETFGKHKALTRLSFEMMPNITDAGLTHLIGLKSLTRLELKSCPQITEAAIAAFQKARPDVTVVR